MQPRLIIFAFILKLVVLIPIPASAQLRNANIYFNWLDVGINTNTGTVLPQVVNNIESRAVNGYSGISDEKTGNLIFATNGNQVCKSDFSLVSNGILDSILDNDYPVIVPYPNQDSVYYLFYNQIGNLYYAVVDMRNGGLVTSKNNLLASGVVNSTLTIVSYVHKQGWWIITHSNNGNQFYAFLLLSNGAIHKPVISQTSIFMEPRITELAVRSSNSGNELAASFGKFDEVNSKYTQQIYILDFDKRCGVVSERRRIFNATNTSESRFANLSLPAFSSNDSKLYLRIQNRLVQYSNVDYTDSVTCFVVENRFSHSSELFTGVDNNIYMVDANPVFSQYDLFKITNADLPYPQCKTTEWTSVKFSTNQFSLYTPGQIMDRSYPDKLPDKLNFNFDNACKEYEVAFSLENEKIYDSVNWFFGDTLSSKNTSNELSPQHTYSSAGDFKVILIGYKCGFSDSLTQVLRVREQPKINLGNDTAVCYQSILTLRSNLQVDDYLWSTGSTDSSITISKGGNYWLQVKLGDCARSDTVKIIENPQIWTALGDEYFICEDDQELLRLDAGEKFVQYKWTPTGDTTQWIIVGNIGEYFVVVKDFRGCDGSDGTLVKRKCDVMVTFPNAFTPNMDGLNEGFGPIVKDVVSIQLSIYNRWGDEVWRTQKIGEFWNGELNGMLASSGVYTYICNYTGFENKRLKEFHKKGTFSLLR